jgi:hypothetical protein
MCAICELELGSVDGWTVDEGAAADGTTATLDGATLADDGATAAGPQAMTATTIAAATQILSVLFT